MNAKGGYRGPFEGTVHALRKTTRNLSKNSL
jgi:hypothetical protein